MKSYNGLSLKQSDVIANSLHIISVAGMLHATQNYTDIADALFDIAQQYLEEAATPSNKQLCSPYNGRLSIGDRIQLARESLGMSYDDLAEKLDIHPGGVLAWEDGDYQPMAGMVIPLANALKCDPMWLLTGESSNHQSPATPVHQSRNQYSGQQRSDASDHASHHVKHQSQA